MPTLKNPRHEQFVQLVVQGTLHGWTQGEIYQRAGFKSGGHAAEVGASRLMKNADIRRRLGELAAPAVKRTKITLETLIDQFDQVFDGAMEDRQFGAAGSAASTKARLVGYLRDRLEIGGPGEFSGCKTPEEVIDLMIENSGGVQGALDQLDQLRLMVEARVSNRTELRPPFASNNDPPLTEP